MAGVKFENITCRYGNHVVLKNFSLEVKESEIMGIVGPSGCGKTTLMRALCGFMKPETGNIYLDDRLVYSASKRVNIAPELRGIGVVFQDYAVWPHLSVWDNVCYPLKRHKVPKAEMEKRAAHALEQVHMTGYEKHLPSQLSGGQQQRVAIARALVSSDELIVLDEPITNLDAKLREEMLAEIQRIQKDIGTTIIYITHDQAAALRLCDNIAVMAPDGHICQIGVDEDIIRRPADRFVFTFVGVSNFIPVICRSGKVFTENGEYPVDTARSDMQEGGRYDLGVRPMDIVFDEQSELKVTIKSVTFLGDQYDYFVDFNGQELRIECNALDALSHRVYEEGEKVGVKFLNVRYYPREEGTAS